MKVGELVRVDTLQIDFHNQIGIVVEIDKSMALFPNDRIYYGVLLRDGKIYKYRYEQLIFSEDLYFSRGVASLPSAKPREDKVG